MVKNKKNSTFSGDEDLVAIRTVDEPYQARMLSDLLKKNGICSLMRDREAGSWLRTVGWGSPYGIDVFVSKDNESAARQIADTFVLNEESVEISEEELAAEAMEAGEQMAGYDETDSND